MPKAYFISDAHLGIETKEVEQEKETQLIAFLGKVKKDGKQLFIVGDLFDFWFEYRTVIPKGYHRLLTKLEELTKNGIEISYLAGNHDFYLGKFFEDELGIKVFPKPFSTSIGKKTFYLHHGDGLANDDLGYTILKKVLRSPINIWLYSWLHPDIGILLAKLTSRRSRDYTSQKNYGAEDGMVKFAEQKIYEGVDYVIMGHHHKPTVHPLGNGYYVNLGDWITHFTYGVFDGKKFQLKTWKRKRV